MPNAVYSHTFLVGCLNIPANYDLSSKVEGKWQRITINQKDYPEYYKSHLNAMTDSDSTSPFIDGIKQYQRIKGKDEDTSFTLSLSKKNYAGETELVVLENYKARICSLRLYFFPLDIVAVVIEIDDSGSDLNDLTMAHNWFKEWNENYDCFIADELKKALEPLAAVLPENGLSNLVQEGNNMKVFQIVKTNDKEPNDELLYELASFSPIGAVGGDHPAAPSTEYYNRIMKENSVSTFKNWKALSLLDSFTVLGGENFSSWTWENRYFPLIYLRCFFEKAFCFSRNNAYRMGEKVENLDKDMSDMEKFYFYNNISSNFQPNLLYKQMAKGMGIKEERLEISRQIKEAANQKREENRNRVNKRIAIITALVSLFAVFSIAWDTFSLIKEGWLSGTPSPRTAEGFSFVSLVAVCVLLILLFRHFSSDDKN